MKNEQINVVEGFQSGEPEKIQKAFEAYQDQMKEDVLLALSSAEEGERSGFKYAKLVVYFRDCLEYILDAIPYTDGDRDWILLKSEEGYATVTTEVALSDQQSLQYVLACMVRAGWHSEIPIPFHLVSAGLPDIGEAHAISESKRTIYGDWRGIEIDPDDHPHTHTSKMYSAPYADARSNVQKMDFELDGRPAEAAFVLALLRSQGIVWDDIPTIDEQQGDRQMFNRLLSDIFPHIPVDEWKNA